MPKPKITRQGIKRVIKGWKGISNKNLKIAEKNMLYLAKKESAIKAIKELETQTQKTPVNEFKKNMEKIIIESLKKGESISQPHFTKAITNKGIKIMINLSSKHALDSINEFNPEKRKHIRKQLYKIDTAAKYGGVISKNSALNAYKEIENTLGRTKMKIFLINYSKTANKLSKVIEKLIENPPINELLK